jgi:hypothetical protein
LIVAALVKILKLILRRQIGLYCWILSASLILGSKMISPKFRRNNSSCPECKKQNNSSRFDLITSESFDKTQLGSHPELRLCCVPFGKHLS